jgi:predicted MFS family arabinose efflux permease
MRGWNDPLILVTLAGGVLLFAAFIAYERRTAAPMLPLGLFSRRNFTVGNVETFAMYGGLGVVFFILVLFLQGVAGFSALEAGSASLPVTLVMFVLAARFGRLADTHGPRWFMGGGPLISAAGLLLMMRLDADVNYWTDLLPALLVFSLGLAMTVAPLTATVLADADEHNAGIASAVNNAIARVAGLVAIAALGALVAANYGTRLEEELGELRAQPAVAVALAEARDRPFAAVPPAGMDPSLAAQVVEAEEDASVSTFRFGIGIAAGLVALGGVLGLIGIVNPRREVAAEGCPGGQFVGAPREACHQSPCDWHRHREAPAAQPA